MRASTGSSRSSLLKDAIWFLVALGLAFQWLLVHGLGIHLAQPWAAILPGVGIFGAAFLLSWGAELAQLEISQALALAFLALMAVLPEYAVDMYLAWTAAKHPSYTAYAAANMTGANRLLIGFGWPVVLLCYWLKTRRAAIEVERGQRIELATLIVATLYAFVIPLKRSFSILDSVVLIGIFMMYIWQSSHAEHVEPSLHGPPARLALLPRMWRRLATLALFALPGYTIFAAAEPFATGLLDSARHLGVEEFILIQWLAPLASESPEFIVAVLFALRQDPTAGLGTLVSSKVNQWTLLIGMLPLVFSISGGHLMPMHLDARQCEELFLTAAQSLMAVIILANWSFGIGEALLLMGMFLLQFVFPSTAVRLVLSGLYLAVALGYLAVPSYRNSVLDLLKQLVGGGSGRYNTHRSSAGTL